MKVLVNLLPDLRQAKQRDKRRRQMITGVAVATWVICGGVVLILAMYTAGQKVLITAKTDSVKDKMTELEQIQGLEEALTASQHLESLPLLYDRRVYLTKFLDAYSQSDPLDVRLSSMTVDKNNLLTVSGSARAYASVAKLARALAVSNVEVGTGASESNDPYFTRVAIGNVSKQGLQGVNFTLTAQMQPGVTSGN